MTATKVHIAQIDVAVKEYAIQLLDNNPSGSYITANPNLIWINTTEGKLYRNKNGSASIVFNDAVDLLPYIQKTHVDGDTLEWDGSQIKVKDVPQAQVVDLVDTLGSHDGRLDGLEVEVSSHDGRLDGLEPLVESHDGRLDGLEVEVSSHDGRLAALEPVVSSHTSRLDALGITKYVGAGYYADINSANLQNGDTLFITDDFPVSVEQVIPSDNITVIWGSGSKMTMTAASSHCLRVQGSNCLIVCPRITAEAAISNAGIDVQGSHNQILNAIVESQVSMANVFKIEAGATYNYIDGVAEGTFTEAFSNSPKIFARSTEFQKDVTFKDTVTAEKTLNHKATFSAPIETGIALNASLGNHFWDNVTGNWTYTLSNIADGQIILLRLYGSGANRTVNFASSGLTVKWAGGTANNLIGVSTYCIFTLFRSGTLLFVNNSRDY